MNNEYNASRKSLINKVKREDIFSVVKSLKEFNYALQDAESLERPNRTTLMRVYKRIMRDSHLRAVIKHRQARIFSLDYNIMDKSENSTDKYDRIFNSTGFKKYLGYVFGGLWYGNSLIELTLDENGLPNPILIPRENVIPEFKQIKVNAYNLTGDFSYDIPAYSNVIDVNNNYDNRDLGELIYVAKMLLIKEEALLNWSQFVELFGQPIRVATTDTKDMEELEELMTFLKELGRSGYMVKNSQTQIDFQSAEGKGVSSDLYEGLQKYINSEVSKVFLGGTMLTDDGSSRSQSEVHERGALLYTKDDLDFISSNINNQLIPVLVKLGVVEEGTIFRFNEPDLMTVDEKIKIDEFILQNFEVEDLNYFSRRYNVNLKPKQNVSQDKGIEQTKE
jgi:hypothetical protein